MPRPRPRAAPARPPRGAAAPPARSSGAVAKPRLTRRQKTAALDADSPLRDANRPGAERIQRVLADLGVASRRGCEELIEAGEVSVNGEPVLALPVWVTPDDRIEVGGKIVHAPPRKPRPGDHAEPKGGAGQAPVRHIYVMLNKPTNTVSTTLDPAGRRTVLDLVQHPAAARLFPVGRLDYDTTGLLLLTNDGDLTNLLTHPRYGVPKTYRAVVKGLLDDESLLLLEKGIYLAEHKEGRTEGAKRAAHVGLKLVSRDRDRTVVEISLKEGRNRQVRRMFAAVGRPVRKLQRLRMGPLSLKGLAVGRWRELTREELRSLRAAVRSAQQDAEGSRPGAAPAPRARPSRIRAAATKQ